MDIPAYNNDVRRTLFLNNIARKPEQIDFRSKAYIARFSELSFERNMQLSAMEGRSDNMELMLALDNGESMPVSARERVKDSQGQYWLIQEVRKDLGADCYICIVNKINK